MEGAVSSTFLSAAALSHRCKKGYVDTSMNPLDNPEGQAGQIRASSVPWEDESA